MLTRNNLNPADRVLLSRDEVNALLGISDTTRQRIEKSDANFPQKIKVSLRRVAYRRADVMRYLSINS